MKDKQAESTPQKPALQTIAETSLYATRLERRKHVLSFDQLIEKLHESKTDLEMKNEELLQAQIALKNAQAYYKDLFDFAPIGYLILNNKGLIFEINLTAAKLLGMERKDIMNLPFEQFIVDGYKDQWHRHFLYASKNGGVHRNELLIRLQNETTSFYQLDCMCNGMDDETSHLRITLTDVTELKLVETRLRIASLALNTQDGTLITDPDNIILCVNLSFTNITGYSYEEAVGRAPYFLHSDGHDKSFYDVIQTTIQQFGFWEGEICYKHKSGKAIPLWLKRSAIKDTDGQISHYVEFFTDINERKKAEEALRIAAVAFEIQEGILVADINRVILSVNRGFTRITGYSDKEVIGKSPIILHSGLHDNAFYNALWDTVVREGYWQGEIWNKRKNGEYFPCIANNFRRHQRGRTA